MQVTRLIQTAKLWKSCMQPKKESEKLEVPEYSALPYLFITGTTQIYRINLYRCTPGPKSTLWAWHGFRSGHTHPYCIPLLFKQMK